MTWHGIEGHDEVVEHLRAVLRRGRLASAYLFVGPDGVGKRTFALRFAQALLCAARPEESLDPCGVCPACSQVEAKTHPDLLLVGKPADRKSLPLELLIGRADHRMREGLCYDLGLRPYMGGRRVAIIADADSLAVEGANALLKTLEEPPPRSVLILVGTSPEQQLPTIRSRCQIVWFRPLSASLVERLLVEKQLLEDPSLAPRLAAYAQGSLSAAIALADPELWSFRSSWLATLAEPGPDRIAQTRRVCEFVEAASGEAPPRRARAKQVMQFAIEFYRGVFRKLCRAPLHDDEELLAAVEKAAVRWPGDAESAAACVERCCDAVRHIDDMVNPRTAIECWLDELPGLACNAARLAD